MKFSASWDAVSSFADQYWSSPPPGHVSPVSRWGAGDWDRWFAGHGSRSEYEPVPTGPGPRPPGYQSPDSLMYEAIDQEGQREMQKAFAREREREREQRELEREREQLLLQATQEVLNGTAKGYLPTSNVLMDDGSARKVNSLIDPRVAQQIDSGNPGCRMFDAHGHEQSGGMQATVVTEQQLHDAIQKRFQDLARQKATQLAIESAALDAAWFAVGFVPVVSDRR